VSGGGGSGWSVPSRLFHWTVAALLGVTIPVGIAMTSEGFDTVRDGLYVAHKGIGVVLLVLVALRAVWRWLTPSPPLPSSIPEGERRLARLTHRLLYVLLFLMAVSGYLRTAGGGYPVELLDALGVPPLVGRMPVWADRLSVLHGFLSYVLVATIAVHVAAVLQHTLFGKTNVLSRMWPPFGSRSS
jgi:cytochrome b561